MRGHGARQTSSPAAPSQACGPRLDWEQGERSLHQARLVGVGDKAQGLLHWNPFDVVVLVVMVHRIAARGLNQVEVDGLVVADAGQLEPVVDLTEWP